MSYDQRYLHESQHLLTYEYWNDYKESGEGSGCDCDGKYAPIEHTNVCQDINDLETELVKKSDIDHTHITDLSPKLTLKSDVGHIHTISDILELVDYLTKMSHFLTEDEINDLISDATKTL